MNDTRTETDSNESAPVRAPYSAPVLEALGEWSALTLQQTVPLNPDRKPSLLGLLRRNES